MSDDLHIPAMAGVPGGRAPISPSYRPRRFGEPGIRAMTIAAVAIGSVLLVGMGSWAVMGRRAVPVPVIEADSRPLRVKPENPGGMQVAGADEQVLGGTGGGADRMAPSPEAPAPQALRAQMQQGAQPPQPASPGAPATPAPVATAPSASPLPDTPARTAPAPRVAAAPAVAPRPATPVSGVQVQLAAVDTEAAAQSEWHRLARRLPDLLGERRPSLQRADRDGHTIWRVRTSGFTDMADATGFCAKMKAKGAACTVASF